MRRRSFLQAIAGTVAIAVATGLGVLHALTPRRIVRALRARRYAGKTRELDESSVRKPATWAG